MPVAVFSAGVGSLVMLAQQPATFKHEARDVLGVRPTQLLDARRSATASVVGAEFDPVKQASLFEPATADVHMIYLYQPETDQNDVKVRVKFVNSEATGLGMPLPAGRVRMFKADDDGSMILLGEDRIGHTPKDEEVFLTVGTAFDIVGEHKIVQQTRISQQVDEREFEIELRNRKNEDVTVRVEKKLWGYWEVLESNYNYEKEDAYTLVLQIPVKANGTAKVNLKVRFTNR